MKKPQVVAVGFLGNPAEVSQALSAALLPNRSKSDKPAAKNKPLARGEVVKLTR